MLLNKNLFFLILLSALFFSCSSFLYQPTSYWYSDPKSFNLEYSEFKILNSDGFNLVGWHFKTKKENPTLILFFHGNAQNITSHYQHLAWLPAKGHEFIIFDYRGYGVSEGAPYQMGLQRDAQAFLNYGYDVYKAGKYKKLIIYAQSLGGAVALRALQDFSHKDEVNLLVLDSTFLSYSEIAKSKLQLSWLTYLFSPLAYILINDETAPWLTLKSHTTPTLVIHGDADFVIPLKFGEELYQKLPLVENKTKWFWKIPGGGHIDAYYRENGKYQNDLIKFIEKI